MNGSRRWWKEQRVWQETEFQILLLLVSAVRFWGNFSNSVSLTFLISNLSEIMPTLPSSYKDEMGKDNVYQGCRVMFNKLEQLLKTTQACQQEAQDSQAFHNAA